MLRKHEAAKSGQTWLEHPRCAGPTILLGDFNATASSVVYRTLARRLKAARGLAPRKSATSTFPASFPLLRIDHLFVSDEVRVLDVTAPFSPLTRAASDHLPLAMDFDLTRREPSGASAPSRRTSA